MQGQKTAPHTSTPLGLTTSMCDLLNLEVKHLIVTYTCHIQEKQLVLGAQGLTNSRNIQKYSLGRELHCVALKIILRSVQCMSDH